MNKPTILCVDDERNVLLTLRNQLMRYFPDFTVEIAESAGEALEVVEDLLSNGHDLPLVIADQIMPNMKGDQFLIELHDRHPKILKVMLTGQASAEDVGNVVNLGNLYRFMSKPWNENDLQLTVSAALRSYQQDRTIEEQYLALGQAKLELEDLNADLEKQVQDRTQQIQLSEERYRILTEVVAVGLFRFDALGQCVYVNNRWCEMTGRPASVAMGTGWVETLHPEDREQLISDWTKAYESDGHYQGEARYLRPDGSIVWFYAQVIPEVDGNGNIISYIGSLTDISDRKLAEERQYQSEQNNRAILAAIPDLLLRVTIDGTCIDYISPNSSTVDFLPINQHLSEVLPPDILEYELQRIQQARETGGLQVWEQKLLRRGVECYEEVRLVPCGDEFLAIVRDITDRKLREAEILRSEAHKTALFQALPDLVMRIDKDGTYLEFQAPQNYSVIGKTGDFIGTKVDESLPSELAQRRMEMINTSLKTKSVQFYEQDLLIDGKIQTEEVRVVPYTENEVLLLVRDISEQKAALRERRLAAAQVQQSEKQLQLTLNFTGIGAWSWSPSTGAYQWNGKMENLLEIPPGLENMFQIWRDRIHVDDVERVEAGIQHALGMQSTFSEEYRYRLSDGQIVWRLVTGQGIYTETGEVDLVLGVVQDITQRKLVEELLKQNEASLVNAQYIAKMGNWEFDLATNQVTWSAGLFPIYGRNSTEWQPTYEEFKQQVHPEDWEGFEQRIKRAILEGIPYEYEHRVIHPNGSIHYAISKGEVVSNPQGQGIKLFGITQDITDRKQAEAALQESEERFQLALEGSGDGLWDWHITTGDVYLSPRWLEMLGYEVDELPQHVDTWASLIHPEDAPWMTQILNAHLQDSSVLYAFDYRVLTKSGTWKWIANYGKVLVRDEDLQPLRMLGTHRDITDRKQYELALHSLLEGTAAVTGKEFFPELVKHIAIALDVSQVYLTQLKGENFETLAWYSDHEIQPNLGFKIANTPCELTFQEGRYACTSLRQLFPQDDVNNVDNYLGVAIQNAAGEKLGVLCVLNHQPLPNPERAEVILRIFAQRAIAELERLEILENLQNLNDELEQRVLERTNELEESRNMLQLVLDTIPQRVFWKDRESRFLGCNPSFASDSSCSVEFIIGKTDLEMPWAEWADLYRADDAMVMNSRTPKLGYEEPLTNFNGDHIWLRTSKIPLTNKNGDLIGILGCYEDISDRKKLEQEQARLTAILEATPDYIGIANAKGEVLWINQQFRKLCPEIQTHDQHRTISDFHPDWANKIIVEQALPIAIQEGTWSGEIALLDGKGGEIPVSQVIISHKSVDGTVENFSTIMRNISDRKQAEKELSQTRNFLEAIIENIPLALFVKSGREEKFGEFLVWNKTSERMFGLTKKQAIGKSGYDFFPQEQSDFFREKDRSSFALAKIEDIPEEPIDSLTLGRRILHTIKVPVFDEYGNPDYLICISEDVSDRKQTEIALKESEENFRASFEQASVGMAQADLNGRFIKLNRRLCDILGFTEAELLNNSFEEITHPDDLAIDRKNVKKLLAGEKTTFSMEKRYIHKDGHIVWANLDVSLINSPNGESVSFFGVIRDISDRKVAEAERDRLLADLSEANLSLEQAVNKLAGYSNSLEAEVEQRTDQLKIAQQQISTQEKLASLGTLTAGVAHELRNPLNFVKNYAEGSIELSRDLLDALEPLLQPIGTENSKLIQSLIADLQENSTSIRRHSQRAEQIITSMMQHAHNDNETAVTQSTDLNALLDQAVRLASYSKRMLDRNFNPSIHTDYASDLGLADVFPGTLSRAFINLVDNACDAMRFKQRNLQADSPQSAADYKPTLYISTHILSEQVEIRIRDNGCGIPLDRTYALTE